MKWTIESVRDELSKYGVTIRKNDGEYRVNMKGGTENDAYYTCCLMDAYYTGIIMAREYHNA